MTLSTEMNQQKKATGNCSMLYNTIVSRLVCLICNKGCVMSHCGLAICIKKYLKAKEKLWKLKYFTTQQNIIFKRNPLKETKILQDIRTL
jgi:hypothetical protein